MEYPRPEQSDVDPGLCVYELGLSESNCWPLSKSHDKMVVANLINIYIPIPGHPPLVRHTSYIDLQTHLYFYVIVYMQILRYKCHDVL